MMGYESPTRSENYGREPSRIEGVKYIHGGSKFSRQAMSPNRVSFMDGQNHGSENKGGGSHVRPVLQN